VSPEGTPPPGDDPNERWFLNDEREFLRRSLDDAEREHTAGDLSDEDFGVLVGRDRRKLAEVELALAALGPEEADEVAATTEPTWPAASPSPKRTRQAQWRRAGIVGCCLLIVVGTVILVSHALQNGSPGQPLTGSVALPKQQLIEEQIQEATTYNDENQDVPALQLFEKVLGEDPTNPEALADAGWLQWKSGFAARSASVETTGRSDVNKAVRLAPAFYKGHLYLGLILLYQDNNDTAAAAQFTKFLNEAPPEPDVAESAAALTEAYRRANLPVPASVTSSTSTTTTTTSAP
jgi:tetratricopeptide (TPR) repeat protein